MYCILECIQYCLREACDVAQLQDSMWHQTLRIFTMIGQAILAGLDTACQKFGGGSDPSHNPHKVQWESQHTPRPLCKKISTIFHYQSCHIWIWRLKLSSIILHFLGEGFDTHAISVERHCPPVKAQALQQPRGGAIAMAAMDATILPAPPAEDAGRLMWFACETLPEQDQCI